MDILRTGEAYLKEDTKYRRMMTHYLSDDELEAIAARAKVIRDQAAKTDRRHGLHAV